MARPERGGPASRADPDMAWTPVTFDLSAERARGFRADIRTYVWYASVAIAIGLFALLGAFSVPPRSSSQVLLAIVAVLFILLPSLVLYYTLAGGLTAIGSSNAGPTFWRTHRPPITIPWADPRLGIVITELTVPPTTLFSGADPRAPQPQWVFVSPPVRNDTTVPPEVAAALARWAEGHGVRVERSPALVFGVASPRSPGITAAARKILPGDPTTPNGRLTLIGPAARSD